LTHNGTSIQGLDSARWQQKSLDTEKPESAKGMYINDMREKNFVLTILEKLQFSSSILIMNNKYMWHHLRFSLDFWSPPSPASRAEPSGPVPSSPSPATCANQVLLL